MAFFRFFLLTLLMLGSGAASRAATKEQAAAVVSQAVDGFIRPAYRAFRDRTLALVGDVDNLCKNPNADTLNGARDSFRRAVGTWSQAEIIRFGPITEENRLDRILFFPDRKGLGLRQIQAALTQKIPDITDPAKLAGKSVAIQGFGALEFVLFGTDSDALANPGGAFRCAYGRAIAANLANISNAVDKAWSDRDGFAARWVSPNADNPLYRTPDESLSELIGVFVDGLEWMRDVRINGFFGEKQEEDKPKQAVYWRSGATLAAIGANLSGLSSLLEASNLEAVLPADSAWIEDSARFEFGNAVHAANDLDSRPVADILNDGKARSRLSYLRLVTSSLSEIFGTRISQVLSLSTGFSSLDGD